MTQIKLTVTDHAAFGGNWCVVVSEDDPYRDDCPETIIPCDGPDEADALAESLSLSIPNSHVYNL